MDCVDWFLDRRRSAFRWHKKEGVQLHLAWSCMLTYAQFESTRYSSLNCSESNCIQLYRVLDV